MKPSTWMTLLIMSCALMVAGWSAALVSMWWIGPVHSALVGTANLLSWPGLVAALGLALFRTELVESQETKPKMYCSDCGTKILTAAGQTLVDQIEEEFRR